MTFELCHFTPVQRIERDLDLHWSHRTKSQPWWVFSREQEWRSRIGCLDLSHSDPTAEVFQRIDEGTAAAAAQIIINNNPNHAKKKKNVLLICWEACKCPSSVLLASTLQVAAITLDSRCAATETCDWTGWAKDAGHRVERSGSTADCSQFE